METDKCAKGRKAFGGEFTICFSSIRRPITTVGMTFYTLMKKTTSTLSTTSVDKRGRRFRSDILTAAGLRGGHSGKPSKRIQSAELCIHWKVIREAVELIVEKDQASRMTTQEKLALFDKQASSTGQQGRKLARRGTTPAQKYLGSGVAIQDIIVDIPPSIHRRRSASIILPKSPKLYSNASSKLPPTKTIWSSTAFAAAARRPRSPRS